MSNKEILNMLIATYGDGKQKEFAKKLGIPSQNVSMWLNRENFDKFLVFKTFRDLSIDWLDRGEGNMFATKTENEATDKSVIEVIAHLRAIIERQQTQIANLISIISKGQIV